MFETSDNVRVQAKCQKLYIVQENVYVSKIRFTTKKIAQTNAHQYGEVNDGQKKCI